MASPGSRLYTEFTDLVTTTLEKTNKDLSDNIGKHNALWRRLTKKGNLKRKSGGLTIDVNLMYAENGTYQRYSGFDLLNVTQNQTLTRAQYEWRSSVANVVASGEELRKNKGDNGIIDLAKARIKVAQKTIANNASIDLYSNGSLSNQYNGIQAVVADTPTNTVGNISGDTYAFWKNIVQNPSSPLQGGGSITASATTILSLMNPLWYRLSRGADVPDFIVMSVDYFTFFEASQQVNQRWAKDDEADAGFVSMKYKNADVFFDQNESGIPDHHAYFLNTDYIEFVAHEDAFLTVMDEKSSVNQDGVVIPVITMGNLTCSNRELQGVII